MRVVICGEDLFFLNQRRTGYSHSFDASKLSAVWWRTMNHSRWWHKFWLCWVQFSLGQRWYAVSLLCKRFGRSIEAESLNCTLKRQKRRGLKLSFPFRSSRERNSISWSINSGSEKYSKMIFSPWVAHKQTPNVIIVILRHQWEILCVVRYEHLTHLLVRQVIFWLFRSCMDHHFSERSGRQRRGCCDL